MTWNLLPVPVVRPQNLGTAEAMIKIAKSQIGYKEGANNDTIFGRLYGLNHQPWCAMFITWCRGPAGCTKIIPRHAYTPAGAQWFKAKGQYHSKPRKGDLHYVFHSSMGRIGHIELVTKVHPTGSFDVVGGNTSNTGSRTGDGVYLLRRSGVRSGSGFGRPKYSEYQP